MCIYICVCVVKLYSYINTEIDMGHPKRLFLCSDEQLLLERQVPETGQEKWRLFFGHLSWHVMQISWVSSWTAWPSQGVLCVFLRASATPSRTRSSPASFSPSATCRCSSGSTPWGPTIRRVSLEISPFLPQHDHMQPSSAKVARLLNTSALLFLAWWMQT